MVMCMPWYCWTMLRRWLIGRVRFFQSVWEGVEVDLLYFFAWENDSISWRLPRRTNLFGKPICVALSIFLFVGEFQGVAEFLFFFPKMAKDFQDGKGERRNQQNIHCSPANKHPLDLGLCGFVAFGWFG